MKFPSMPVLSNQGSTLNFDRLQKELSQPWKLVSLLGFEHGWEVYEAGLRLPEYRKVFDIVELRGLVKAGESGKSAFTLPSGYRPRVGINPEFIVEAAGSTGYISVGSTGTVVPVSVGGEVKVYTFLDTVRFSVA